MEDAHSMSAMQVLNAAKAAGVNVVIDGEGLVLQAPSPPPPAVIHALSRYKAEIVALLRPAKDGWRPVDWRAFFDERAGIRQFDAGLAKPAAEVQAFEACIIEWLNRNPAPSPAGRCAWCGERETQSTVVVPFGTEPGTHAWIHAECWRPWHDSRRAEAVKALYQVLNVIDNQAIQNCARR
jgi:hypothetical protein